VSLPVEPVSLPLRRTRNDGAGSSQTLSAEWRMTLIRAATKVEETTLRSDL
jgi:hypothetical protein